MRPLDPRVLPHLGVARGPLAVVVGGNVLGAALLVAQALALATGVARLVADPSGTGWHAPIAVFVVVLVARAAIGYVVDVAAARAALAVGSRLRDEVLAAVLRPGPSSSGRTRLGELSILATRGVAAVEPYLTRYVPALVLAIAAPAVIVLAIASLDWMSALVVVLTLPLLPVFAVLIGMTTRERADRQWRTLGQLAGHFVDVVRGLPTLVSYRRGEAQAPRIREVTDRYRRANGDVLKLAFASAAALELIATISVALVAVLVGLRLAGGGIELQTALAVLLLAPEAYWPIRKVGAEFHAAAEGTATFEAIHELTSSVPSPTPPSPTATPHDASGLRGDLHLEGVRVTWPGRTRPALAGVDTVIPGRGLCVVTGPSGCGKSTLLAALRGEVAYEGSLRAGGTDLAGLDPALWPRSVATASQRPWLRDATIAANVRIGRPDADDDAIRDALAAVGLLDHVAALPEGIDTALGEDGAGLSAGQRARLAMARIVVSERPYVLLDEPTAHLDPATETAIVAVIRELARTRCVVAVSHRPALADAADTHLALSRVGASPAPVARGSLHLDPDETSRVTPRNASSDGPDTAAPPPDATQGQRERQGRWVLATALGVASATCGVALTATAGWLIVRASEQPPVLMLMVAIVGVRAFGLGRPAARYAERLVSHDIGLRELAVRRAQVYDVLVPLVPGRIGGRRRGDLLTTIVDDVDSHLDERLRVRMPVATAIGVLVAAAFVTVWILPVAAVAAVGTAGVAALLTWTTARRGTAALAPRMISGRADLSTLTLTALTDARELLAWDLGGPVRAEVRRADADLGRASLAVASRIAAARAWAPLAAAAAVAVVAPTGARALGAGEVSAPLLALLLLLPLALIDVVTPLADAGSLRVSTAAARRRIDALGELTAAVSDPSEPVAAPGSADLALRGVSAGWDDRTALAPVDLDLPAGRHVGVIGPSGSGKSTLAAVLVRHLDVRSGAYTLGGTDVGDLRVDDVRARVAFVDDEPYLFGSSVAENIRLARPDADDADVARALLGARLDLWLADLPDGLHTRLGDGGSEVSGGERARLGLARALLADAPVLVLDEPTAHLDVDTARSVADDLIAASAQRTLVWITHDGIGLEEMDAVLQLGVDPSDGTDGTDGTGSTATATRPATGTGTGAGSVPTRGRGAPSPVR